MRRMRGVRQKHGTKLTKPMRWKNMQNWASRMNRKNRMSRMNRKSQTSLRIGEFSICSRICVNWNCTEACARWCRSAIP